MYIQLQLDISFGVPQCNSIGCCSLPLMNGLLYNNDMMLVTTFLVAYFLFNTLSMYSPVKICKSSLHRWWGNHHHVTRKKHFNCIFLSMWQKWIKYLDDTVDASDIRRSPLEVGSSSQYLQWFLHPKGGCFGFLNNQCDATIPNGVSQRAKKTKIGQNAQESSSFWGIW